MPPYITTKISFCTTHIWKNRCHLRYNDNFVNTTNFSNTIFRKLSLKPQDDTAFKRRFLTNIIFKNLLWFSIKKKCHRVTFSCTTSSPYRLCPQSATILCALPYLVCSLTHYLLCVSSLTDCSSCRPSPTLYRARTRGLRQSAIPEPNVFFVCPNLYRRADGATVGVLHHHDEASETYLLLDGDWWHSSLKSSVVTGDILWSDGWHHSRVAKEEYSFIVPIQFLVVEIPLFDLISFLFYGLLSFAISPWLMFFYFKFHP